MKNFLKYGVVPLVVGAFLLCITLMLLPVLINVQMFLPQIEKQVAQHTGRSFSVGSDFGLTFFPWLSVTFSDMHLGNPEGVAGADFIDIDSFEARVKLLPLLLKKVEVSRFVVSGLNINLSRDLDGRVNWQMFQSADTEENTKTRASHLNWILERDVAVELFAVTGGKLAYVDKAAGVKHRVEDLMILLNDVSSTDKAKADIKAVVDGEQMRATGSIGPVSASLESLATDLRLQINNRIQAIVQGECSYPVENTKCDLNFTVPRFALADLYEDGTDVKGNKDTDFLQGQAVELNGQFFGNVNAFSINSGTGVIDETSFTYSLSHESKREVQNEITITFNALDLDRYFPPAKPVNKDSKARTDSPVVEMMRASSFTAHVKGRGLTLKEVLFKDVDMQLSVVDGLLKADDGAFTLHGGNGTFNASIGLNQEPVTVETSVKVQDVQAGPFSEELIGSTVISGSLSGNLSLKQSDISGSDGGKAFLGNGLLEIDGGTIAGLQLLTNVNEDIGSTTNFDKLSADLTLGAGVVYLKPLSLLSGGESTVMSAVVELDDKSFSVSPEGAGADLEILSIAGTYGREGLAIDGFTDVHETKIHELRVSHESLFHAIRDAQTLVDEKMPAPVEEDVSNIVGTPLIDPAIVAERFGLRPELIKPSKSKKAYSVGRGRVIVHDLKEFNSSLFVE